MPTKVKTPSTIKKQKASKENGKRRNSGDIRNHLQRTPRTQPILQDGIIGMKVRTPKSDQKPKKEPEVVEISDGEKTTEEGT